MKYCAIYMPSTEGKDPSRCGFNSEDEAWDYVVSWFCDDCTRKYENDQSGISCSAEWDIGTEDEWKEIGMAIDDNGNIIEEV